MGEAEKRSRCRGVIDGGEGEDPQKNDQLDFAIRGIRVG